MAVKKWLLYTAVKTVAAVAAALVIRQIKKKY